MSRMRNSLRTKFKDFEYRHAYVEDFLHTRVAAQIKVLREQRGLSQKELAELAGMKQSRISMLENVNYRRWNVGTLLKLARAFDLMLVVKFEGFGAGLSEIDSFSRISLEKGSFAEDHSFVESTADNTIVNWETMKITDDLTGRESMQVTKSLPITETGEWSHIPGHILSTRNSAANIRLRLGE